VNHLDVDPVALADAQRQGRLDLLFERSELIARTEAFDRRWWRVGKCCYYAGQSLNIAAMLLFVGSVWLDWSFWFAWSALITGLILSWGHSLTAHVTIKRAEAAVNRVAVEIILEDSLRTERELHAEVERLRGALDTERKQLVLERQVVGTEADIEVGRDPIEAARALRTELVETHDRANAAESRLAAANATVPMPVGERCASCDQRLDASDDRDAYHAALLELPTFEQVWAAKEREGYQYGEDALEQVRFGFELARGLR
jgi:hypothetical protein